MEIKWRFAQNEETKPEQVLEAVARGSIDPAAAVGLLRQMDRPVRWKAEGEEAAKDRLQEIMRELEMLIGLKSVKKLIAEMQAFVQIQRRRASEQLATEPMVLHMIFKGNPGTGKTTVARIVGKLFKEMGVLPKGHLTRKELILIQNSISKRHPTVSTEALWKT